MDKYYDSLLARRKAGDPQVAGGNNYYVRFIQASNPILDILEQHLRNRQPPTPSTPHAETHTQNDANKIEHDLSILVALIESDIKYLKSLE